MSNNGGTGRRPGDWRALGFFNLYRIIIASLFLLLVLTDTLPPPLGSYHPTGFSICAIVYICAAIMLQISMEMRLLGFTMQVFLQVLVDVLLLTGLMFTSGGISSGFGILMIVSVAGGSILTGGRMAYLFAAMASLAVLAEELYFWVYDYFPISNYTPAGLLGATFFTTAFLGHVFASRIHTSEALAAQRSVDLRNMARLNETIVQRMQSGILVLDSGGHIRLANDSARALLGGRELAAGTGLETVSSELAACHRQWVQDRQAVTRLVQARHGGTDVWASLTGLPSGSGEDALIFLEDASRMRQRAQQLKLASLGRLTASIAHEIRNPLGAISHASQLLHEAEDTTATDRRLMDIIDTHCGRVNAIIENVLQLSRRQPSVPEGFLLQPWLEDFIQELLHNRGLTGPDAVIDVTPPDLRVTMDPSQLHQVVTNLCENALRYSRGTPLLRLRAGLREDNQRPYLDIIDSGPGIPEGELEHIFEPFFTRDAQGTGLGLYIARELCEGNQASLQLQESSARGCCFRISFAHPDREQVMMP